MLTKRKRDFVKRKNPDNNRKREKNSSPLSKLIKKLCNMKCINIGCVQYIGRFPHFYIVI